MNVRVDWEPGGGQPQQPRRPSRGPAGPGKKPGGKYRRRNLQLVGAVGVGLVAVVVAALAVPTHKHKTSSSPSSPVASSSASGPAASGASGGLPRGTASAFGLDGATRVSGVPRGFAHTTNGAVEAATTAAASVYTVERMTPTDRAAYLSSVYGAEPAGAEADAQSYQQQNNLNSQGQLLDPSTGQPSTTEQFTSLCHPELGAYRVVDSSLNAVSVDVWQVCLTGTIGDGTPQLTSSWDLGQFNMQWKGGDWQIASTGNGGVSTAPTPSQSGQVATTYAQRAQLLAPTGGGWELYSDATDTPPAEMGTGQ